MNNDSPSISRRKLAGFIHSKLQGRIFHSHIFAITSLLFEEMMNDLKSGNEIKIIGLGTLSLKERAPKPFFDVNFREMRISKGTRNLVFSIDPDLRAKIVLALDNPSDADDTGGDDGGA